MKGAPEDELMALAREMGAPYELVLEVKRLGKLPVKNFAAGGIATPADAALMMQLGADGIFVGSGIFKSKEPEKRARAIVEAALHYDNPELLVDISRRLGEAMQDDVALSEAGSYKIGARRNIHFPIAILI